MRSSKIDGKILDWEYEKSHGQIFFHIGKYLIGTLSYSKKNGWSATPWGYGSVVHGFKTRSWASEFLFEQFRLRKGF